MKLSTWLMIVLGGVVLAVFAPRAHAIDPALAGTADAPELEAGLEWLNTDRPLRLADLKGKVVLVDFWTYCCINCVHVMPDLKRLEAKYPNELVVVGVHSAKFATEKGADSIRDAILRHDLAHPVVNDKDFAIWNAYGAHGWPTFVLIDPDGRRVRKRSGEGVYDAWEPTIAQMVKAWDAEKRLDRRPPKWALERDKAPRSLLRFPGKVAADAKGTRLAIADSSHNRIVVVAPADGSVLEVIGGGGAGLTDGPFAAARFNRPQGVAFDGDDLYVADTENHAVRAASFKDHKVTTLAGTGAQARKFNVPGVGREVALNSPWDVAPHGDRLFVAMAGAHQIWTIDVVTHEAKPFAGSSREHLFDAPLLDAALAQPSGLAIAGRTIYSADSETSSIRAVDLAADGRVTTLLGKGLFDFGDVDGKLADARLQHPLGVLWHDGMLYVADTYNHKVKRLDPKAGTIATVAGTGRPGFKDGPAGEAMLNEPSGLAFASGRLYIADTNNHVIRIYDPKANRVETLRIREPAKLARNDPATFTGRVVKAAATARVGVGDGTVAVNVKLPAGFKLNADAPLYIAASAVDGKVIEVAGDAAGQNVTGPTFPLALKVRFASAGTTTLWTDLVVYYCDEKADAVCLVDQVRVETVVEVMAGAVEHLIPVDVSAK